MEGKDAERVDLWSGIRCGTCHPSGSADENNRLRESGVHPLYAQLLSKDYSRAQNGVRQLLAAEPKPFGMIRRALDDPRLADMREEFLVGLAQMGEQALPMAEFIAKFLDGSKMPEEVCNYAAYALGSMGKKAEPIIHAWMSENPAAAWKSWPSVLLHIIGTDRSAEFLRIALTSDNRDCQRWARRIIAADPSYSLEQHMRDEARTLRQ